MSGGQRGRRCSGRCSTCDSTADGITNDVTVSVAEGETVALRTADDGADGAVDCTVVRWKPMRSTLLTSTPIVVVTKP